MSRGQIGKAYGVLAELQTLIKEGKPQQFLVDACNRFYTLIPHSFGVDEVPIINDEETVKVSGTGLLKVYLKNVQMFLFYK